MAANPIREYLLTLTSRKAYQLFLIAAVLGSLSIWFDIGVPWLPAVIVAFYGMLLFYSAKVCLVTHSEMTNNSPYFLGFLFFLIALFSAFSKTFGANDNVDVGMLLRQLGAALLTTIIGLPFRQLLFAYAPAQQDQDTFYRNLEEELRRSATEFRKSQADLLDLLKIFIQTRDILFAEEERASKKYIKGLSKAASIFDGFHEKYPELISSALEGASVAILDIKDKLEVFNRATGEINPHFLRQLEPFLDNIKVSFRALDETAQGAASAFAKVGTAAGAVPQDLNAVGTKIKMQADELSGELRIRAQAISRDLEQIDAVLEEFVTVAVNRISQLR